MSKPQFLVLSALGQDRPGIVNKLSGAVLNLGCSISDSRMTVLGGEFSIMLLIEGPWNILTKLEDTLPEIQSELELTIISKRTESPEGSGQTLPYSVEVVALDHPGIVHHLAGFFSDRNINIQDMATSTYAAAHTGSPMFAVDMTIAIPATTQLSVVREEFMDFCDAINLDAVLEPIKG